MPLMLETAGSPCIEPYITGLYQHALTTMRIAFDTLLIPGHEWDTGEIPEHNVISIHGIYEKRAGTDERMEECRNYFYTSVNAYTHYTFHVFLYAK